MKVDVVLEANGRAVVNVQLAAKDGVSGTSHNEIDIPVNDETAQAATKIQAKFRRSVLSCFSFLWVAAVHASIRQAKASGR